MDELTKVALLGTSRYAGPIPTGDAPAASLVAARADDDREESLLLACGAQAVYALAGRQSHADIEPPAAASQETRKIASRKLAAFLQAAASSNERALLLEFLGHMRVRGVALPLDLLPQFLEFKDGEIRRNVIPVLGERGVWLCRQNPDWTHFLTAAVDRPPADIEDLNRVWDEGRIEERSRTMETLRQVDPTGARERLEEAFPKEKPANRLKLLLALRIGLDDRDEPFLERCLNDRSAGVSQLAASLLCRLPESALAKRMLSRADAILTLENGPVLKKPRLTCTPPADITPDWERDGIKKKVAEGIGLRASWVEHLLGSLPPSHWAKKFGLEPKALILALADDPFASAVISGWTSAALAFATIDPPSTDWLEPLWQHHAGALESFNGNERVLAIRRMESLLHFMAADVAEAALVQALEATPGLLSSEALGFLAAWPEPWSVRFSTWLLATARARLHRGSDESAYRWAAALAANACRFSPETFPLALAPWTLEPDQKSATWFAAAIPREIDKLRAVIEKRQHFLQELGAQDPLTPEP